MYGLWRSKLLKNNPPTPALPRKGGGGFCTASWKSMPLALEPGLDLFGIQPAQTVFGRIPPEHFFGVQPAQALLGRQPAQALLGGDELEQQAEGLGVAEQLASVAMEVVDRISHLGDLQSVMKVQLGQEFAGGAGARVVVLEPVADALHPDAEQLTIR